MDIKEISTEALIEEINRRKKVEAPVLIKEINSRLEELKTLVGDIKHETEPFKLEKLSIDDDGEVVYIDYED